jgi:uncharacterized protein YoxC
VDIYPIIAGAVALAVIILIVFLVRSLISITRTMNLMNQHLQDLKGKVEEAVDESTRTLKETRLLVEDLRVKSQQTEELFKSAQEVSKSLQEASVSIVQHAEAHKDRLSHVVALLGVGMDLIKQWRGNR